MASMQRQQPFFPVEAKWELPRELVDIPEASCIGLDIETRDPQLKAKGPGVRRDGYIVGISVAVPEGKSWYYPFGHAEGRQFEKEQVLKWAKNNLCRPNQPKLGANLIYDLDYLLHEGVEVSGPFYDVQIAEALIDENCQAYSLDSLAKRYLGEAKRQTTLEKACENFGLKGKPQEHIWRLDPKYSGEYAEGDAQQALEIFEKQKIILKKEDLEQVFDIETRLIPMLLHMRQTGVRVDIDSLLQLHDQLQLDLEMQLSEDEMQGIDIWNAASIAEAFDDLGLSYPLTPKTKKPSFVKGWLEKHPSEIAQKIVKCRQLHKLIGTFVEGSLLEMLIGDRIHCQFNQLKGDDYGARTGRFSCSHPNLQQIPIRTALGKLLRQVFIPDQGYNWCKADYSQIEIRILAHYAMGAGSDAIRKAFNDNPKVDYHLWCAMKTGLGKDGRDQAKSINFGIIYGMGWERLSADLGISVDEAALFIDNYFSELPFLEETINTATQVAEQRGYIKTILGRRRRFDMWEPADRRLYKKVKAHRDKSVVLGKIDNLGFAKGIVYSSQLKRAACYRAFNAADQGSAADIMKLAMVNVWESGLCNVIKPYLTIHDELDFGYPDTREGKEAVEEVKNLMENAYKLSVPLIVDIETGPNWGQVKG